jgi:hypothetical protein
MNKAEFIEKLSNPEPWLKENALKHIQWKNSYQP